MNPSSEAEIRPWNSLYWTYLISLWLISHLDSWNWIVTCAKSIEFQRSFNSPWKLHLRSGCDLLSKQNNTKIPIQPDFAFSPIVWSDSSRTFFLPYTSQNRPQNGEEIIQPAKTKVVLIAWKVKNGRYQIIGNVNCEIAPCKTSCLQYTSWLRMKRSLNFACNLTVPKNVMKRVFMSQCSQYSMLLESLSIRSSLLFQYTVNNMQMQGEIPAETAWLPIHRREKEREGTAAWPPLSRPSEHTGI